LTPFYVSFEFLTDMFEYGMVEKRTHKKEKKAVTLTLDESHKISLA